MDRFSVEYTIGGRIKAPLVPKLIKAIQNVGLGIEWDEGYGDDDLLMAIKQCCKHVALSIMNNEVSGGNTDELDAFCIKHNLSFDKRVDGKYEYNGEIHWWKPGLFNIQSWFDTDKEGKRIMIGLETLEKNLKQGKTLAQVVKRLHRVAPPIPGLIVVGKLRTPQKLATV